MIRYDQCIELHLLQIMCFRFVCEILVQECMNGHFQIRTLLKSLKFFQNYYLSSNNEHNWAILSGELNFQQMRRVEPM